MVSCDLRTGAVKEGISSTSPNMARWILFWDSPWSAFIARVSKTDTKIRADNISGFADVRMIEFSITFSLAFSPTSSRNSISHYGRKLKVEEAVAFSETSELGRIDMPPTSHPADPWASWCCEARPLWTLVFVSLSKVIFINLQKVLIQTPSLWQIKFKKWMWVTLIEIWKSKFEILKSKFEIWKSK